MKILLVLLLAGASIAAHADPVSFTGRAAMDTYKLLSGPGVMLDAGAGHVFKTGTDISCQGPTDPRLQSVAAHYACTLNIDSNGKIVSAQ